MSRITPLPSSISSWDTERVRDAKQARIERVEEIAATPLADLGASEANEMKSLNDDLQRLRDEPTLPHPGHPPYPGSKGRQDDSKFGRVSGLGDLFMKQMRAGNAGDLKSSLDATSGGASLPGSFFDSRLREMPQRSLFLRSLIPTERVNSNIVLWVRQTAFTNNAAAVSAGSAKPTSVLSAEQVSSPVRVIAHVSEAIDRSILMDYDQLTQFIDSQLRLGVLLAEEDQILNGNGTAPNLSGILDQSPQTQAKGTDSTPDAVLKAITKVRNYYAEPDAVCFHPNDWMQIASLTTADGIYIWGSPSDATDARIWGKRVITSPVIAEGTALVGAFGVGAVVYEREEVRISFAETGLGDVAGEELFGRNLCRFRAESRLAVAVPFPNFFCTVTGI